jgi:hypothetical protein
MLGNFLIFLYCLVYAIASPEKSRADFYSKLLNTHMFKSVNLVADNEGLYLTFNEKSFNIENLGRITKEYIFSSCDFFPFRDLFTRIIVQYYKQAGYKGTISLNDFVNRFIVVYHMLFTKLANEERVRDYFKTETEKVDEYYSYKVSEKKRSYVSIIPGHTTVKPIYTAIWFSYNDVENAKRIRLNMHDYDLNIGLFGYVNKYIYELEDAELKVPYLLI